MNRRNAVTAILLASLFFVPLLPMAGATTPASFGATVVSGNTVDSSSAHYNFTFTTGSGASLDDTLEIKFPSGWDASNADATDNNFPPTFSEDSANTLFVNVSTSASFVDNTNYYVNITGINPPRTAGASTITAVMWNKTDVASNPITTTITVPAADLPMTLDAAKDDDIGFGSESTTDYFFAVATNSFDADTDWINVTFPVGFDLSDAEVTATSGTTSLGVVSSSNRKAGYDLQSGNAAGAYTFAVRDVVNPKVTTSTDYNLNAVLMDSAGNTIATEAIEVTIVPTSIEVTRGGSSAVTLTEGGTEDGSIKVELGTKPSEDVTITLDGDDQVTFDKATLTFTPSNWDTQQVVFLTAVDDADVEGTINFDLVLTADSDDTSIDNVEETFRITIVDNDDGLVLRHVGDDTTVTEGDTAGDTYQVLLATKPDDSVTVAITPDAGLKVSTDEVRFTVSNWNVPKAITVTSDRSNDNEYTAPQDLTIAHSSTSDDDDYDGLSLDLDVTVVDDEHQALGLTQTQIDRANKLVKVTLTEEDDHIHVAYELPDQDDLDDIFDSDGDITIQGVQVLYANSPYTLAETIDGGSDGSFEHDKDDGATLRTKYLVTMFFNEDVGKWGADDLPDTRDDGYAGTAIKEGIDWWVWLLIGIGGLIILVLIILAIVAAQGRRSYGGDWDDEDDAVVMDADDEDEAPAKSKGKSQKYDLECPVCDHQFSARGKKPLKTECPNCGAKGVLN